MIVYFDGGSYKKEGKKDKRKFVATYGVLFHNGGEQPLEKKGKAEYPMEYVGLHEYFAFLHSYQLVKSTGVNPKAVSYYTDCKNIAYAQTLLHTENYRVGAKQNFLNFFDKALAAVGMENQREEILDCLSNARFVKVKAHRKTVDNLRVDYLSKMASSERKPISYHKFLGCSFFRYAENEIIRFNLPFMPDKSSPEMCI